MERRHSLSIRDWIIVSVILIVCCLVYWIGDNVSSKEQLVALVYQDDRLIYQIPLEQTEDQKLYVDKEQRVSVQVKGHRIRFFQVDCPDKICEQSGYLGKEGDTAVCMPNRCYIVIKKAGDVE